MSDNLFYSQMQTMYDYVNVSPKLAGTFFSVMNYLALSNIDGKYSISQDELHDRFSYRKEELGKILRHGMEIGLIENDGTSYRINQNQTSDLSKSLHSLFKMIKINSNNTIANNSKTDPISILYKCREALYNHDYVSS